MDSNFVSYLHLMGRIELMMYWDTILQFSVCPILSCLKSENLKYLHSLTIVRM